MDSSNWTPNKNKMNCDSIMMLSPITKTPIRQNSIRLKNSFQNCTNSFSVLPNHITPPSGLTKFMARNPFEADLTNKLHISVLSPTVFSKTCNTSPKDSPTFAWSIDEIALIQPAKIDEFPVQQMHCSDPEIEKNAQEAISRFFSENQIIPSPYDVKRIEPEKRSEMHTPVRSQEEMNSSRESCRLKKEKKDNWAQTVLTLPPELPPHIEEILKPYFNFNQDQNCETDEANSSNTSLRRKLFANHDDSQDDLTDSATTPSKIKSSLNHDLSPPQSGMFFHGTPLRKSQIIQRTYGSPLACSGNSSPCDVSPINNPTFDMSCQSIVSRNRSGVKLDFTNDMSFEEAKDTHKNMCKTLFPEENKTSLEMNFSENHTDGSNNCEVTQMVVSSENSVRFRSDDKENVMPFAFHNANQSNVLKTNFSESYAMQQSKMLSGNYLQQMAFTSNHDTGYQTYSSSSNLANNTDSYSFSIKQKLHLDERVVQTDDEVQLPDWENMKSMISSTPSKLQKGISNY